MLVGKRARFAALHNWITRQPGCRDLSERWLRDAIRQEASACGPLPIEPDAPARRSWTADGASQRWSVDPVRENARVLAERRNLEAYFCKPLVTLVLGYVERDEAGYALNLVARAAVQVEHAGRIPAPAIEVIRRFTSLAPNSPARRAFEAVMIDRLDATLTRKRRTAADRAHMRKALKGSGMVRLSPEEQKRRQTARKPRDTEIAPYIDGTASTSVRTLPGSYGSGKRR
jgi:hypothetical protein